MPTHPSGFRRAHVARATTTEVMKVECVTDASLEALRMRRTDECSSSGGPSLWADATLEGAAPYSDPDTLAWLPMVCVALDDSPQDLATDEPGDALLRYYAVQSPPRPPTENTREKGPDFYTNAGDAIRTLRRELPNLFSQELTCKAPPLVPLCRASKSQSVVKVVYVANAHNRPRSRPQPILAPPMRKQEIEISLHARSSDEPHANGPPNPRPHT